MADIWMCSGEKCPRKKSCYRYTAPVNEYWQAYFLETPGVRKDGKFICNEYISNKPYKIRKK